MIRPQLHSFLACQCQFYCSFLGFQFLPNLGKVNMILDQCLIVWALHIQSININLFGLLAVLFNLNKEKKIFMSLYNCYKFHTWIISTMTLPARKSSTKFVTIVQWCEYYFFLVRLKSIVKSPNKLMLIDWMCNAQMIKPFSFLNVTTMWQHTMHCDIFFVTTKWQNSSSSSLSSCGK